MRSGAVRGLAVALVVALAALVVPSPATPSARAASPVGVGDIVAGSVGRTSLSLRATYDAFLRLSWARHRIRVDATLTVANTSGAGIDRLELNTIAARLGGMRLDAVTVDGVSVRATRDDQTLTVPLGGILPAGGTTTVRVRFMATLRTTTTGSNWMFAKANGIVDLYRWLPWVSRTTPFSRPNHGDPFVTPVSPSVRVRITTDRRLTLATSGDRVSLSADGLTQVYVAHDVRDFTVTAAADYRITSRVVGDHVVRAYTRPGASGAAFLDATADAFKAIEARLGPYPYRVFRVAQSAGGYGMESPGLIWLPGGVARSNLRYLAAHEAAHQWFYGIVGNDQARQPFADEAAADMVARSVTGTRRASRCATARLDRSIYAYSAACYYETIYVQGGNLIDAARRRIGTAAFWAAMRGYVADHRFGFGSNRALLRALDDATAPDLGATLFAPRFPSIY